MNTNEICTLFALQFVQTSNVSKWVVQYGKDTYEAGEYMVKVNVKKRILLNLYVDVGTAVNTFNLTSK